MVNDRSSSDLPSVINSQRRACPRTPQKPLRFCFPTEIIKNWIDSCEQQQHSSAEATPLFFRDRSPSAAAATSSSHRSRSRRNGKTSTSCCVLLSGSASTSCVRQHKTNDHNQLERSRSGINGYTFLGSSLTQTASFYDTTSSTKCRASSAHKEFTFCR